VRVSQWRTTEDIFRTLAAKHRHAELSAPTQSAKQPGQSHKDIQAKKVLAFVVQTQSLANSTTGLDQTMEGSLGIALETLPTGAQTHLHTQVTQTLPKPLYDQAKE